MAEQKNWPIIPIIALILLFALGGAVGWIIRPMDVDPPQPPPPCPTDRWPHVVNSKKDVLLHCDEVLRDIVKRGLDAMVAAVKADPGADLSDIRKAIELARQCSAADCPLHDAIQEDTHIEVVDKAWVYAENNKWKECWQALVADPVNHPH